MFRVFLGAICISFAPILVKAVDLGPTVSAFYRCAIAAVFLFFMEPLKGRQSRQYWIAAVLGGFIFALDLWVWHRSIHYIGAGVSTILANTQVFYIALLGIFVFREKANRWFLVSIPLAFVGVFLLVGKPAGFLAHVPEGFYGLGVFYGVATGICYALYLTSLRHLDNQSRRARGVQTASSTQNLAFISLFASIFLFASAVSEDVRMTPSPEEWGFLLILALLVQVVGWILISRQISKIPVSVVGLVLLTQPALSVVWGALIYEEGLSGRQVFGVVVTLAAIYLGGTQAMGRSKKTEKIAEVA